MSRSSGAVARSVSMASGLLFSTPITVRSTPSACIITRIPKCTRSGYSTIIRWSVVRYGSHSAPLISRCRIRTPSGTDSLTCAGNAAPPMPTMPAICTASIKASRDSSRQSVPVPASTCCVENASASMPIAGAKRPSAPRKSPILLTVPVTGLCNAVDTKPPGFAISCPRRTRSPASTTASAGTPMCCPSGIT